MTQHLDKLSEDDWENLPLFAFPVHLYPKGTRRLTARAVNQKQRCLMPFQRRPPLSRYRVQLYLPHIRFLGIAGYRATSPPFWGCRKIMLRGGGVLGGGIASQCYPLHCRALLGGFCSLSAAKSRLSGSQSGERTAQNQWRMLKTDTPQVRGEEPQLLWTIIGKIHTGAHKRWLKPQILRENRAKNRFLRTSQPRGGRRNSPERAFLGLSLRWKWPYTEWETGPVKKNPGKMLQKMENGPRPEMATTWPLK